LWRILVGVVTLIVLELWTYLIIVLAIVHAHIAVVQIATGVGIHVKCAVMWCGETLTVHVGKFTVDVVAVHDVLNFEGRERTQKKY